MLAQSLQCPECGSKRIWKAGLRTTTYGEVQRYICRDCGFRFSDPEFSRKISNSSYDKEESRQICALETKRVKNLVKVEPRTETALRESTQDTKGQIISFAWHLKKMGRTEATIKTYTSYIEILMKHGNISDPEATKLTIANHFTDQNTKRLATYAYDSFLKFLGIPWEKPHYRKEDKRVFIPSDEELWLAVNCGRKQSFAFSLLIYETGARVNEAERLEWTDIDSERNKLSIKASKNGNARIITVSKKLIDLLLSLPKKEKTVFPKLGKNARQTAFHYRLWKLSIMHNNPRLLKIHYHTFRHCKALREYHKTKSILHVKKVLGHKSIMTTQRYVELYTEIYGDLRPENYVCKTASTVKEAKKLIEQGFEYICEIEGEKLFRKFA